MVKSLFKIFLLFLSLLSVACNTRTKVEPCDFSYVISCSSYYSDQEDFQACLQTLGGESCSLSTEEIADVNASLAQDIKSYTCSSANSYVEALVEQGYSVTHTPDLNTSSHYYYVDAFHNLFAEYEGFDVVRSLSVALELAESQDVIVVCPGEYLENIEITGDDKDNLTLLNIAGGSEAMAPYTQLSGELSTDSVLKISGVSNLAIKGFTIKNGSASLLTGSGSGGGIWISNLRSDAEPVLIQNSFVQDNTAFGDGGGIYIEGSSDVTLENVHLLRNTSTFGRGGAVAIKSLNNTPKTFFCNDCLVAQNQSYFSGSAFFVEGQDRLILQNSEVTLNSGISDFSFGAIAFENQGMFYSQLVEWGEGANENLQPDIVLLSELQKEVEAVQQDLWQQLALGAVTAQDMQNFYNDFLDENGLLPGQYDYNGLTSVACYFGMFTDRCDEL